jgi:hypothetical protein
MKNVKILLLFLLPLAMMQTSCTDEPPPTKTLMQGNWELVEATDAGGSDIKSKVAFPVTVVQLTDDNGMVGTIGPMFTYLVYGPSKWIEVSAKIKQVFDYANFRFNTGEFFVESGQVQTFTVEGKLQATAALGGLKDILEILGVGQGYIQQTIYHKFLGVSVTFPGLENKGTSLGGQKKEYNTMIWEFTDSTIGAYNYKDGSGNYVLWQGWPVDKFTRARFVFEKRTQGINEIVSSNL